MQSTQTAPNVTEYRWPGESVPDPRTDPVELNPPKQADRYIPEEETNGAIAASAPADPWNSNQLATQPQPVQRPPFQAPAPMRTSPFMPKQQPAQPPTPQPAQSSPEELQESLAQVLIYLQQKSLGMFLYTQAYALFCSGGEREALGEISSLHHTAYLDAVRWAAQLGRKPTVVPDSDFTDGSLFDHDESFIKKQFQDLLRGYYFVSNSEVATAGLKHWARNLISVIEMKW